MSHADSLRAPVAIAATLFFAVVSASGGATAAAGGGKPCSYGAIAEVTTVLFDWDSDLFNDSFEIYAQFQPSPSLEAWLNVTVLAPNGSTVGNYSSAHMTDNISYTSDYYSFSLLNATDPNGTYSAQVTYDFTEGACAWFDYFFELRPPGDYQPTIDGAILAQSTDINRTVTFALSVTNFGNNPDSFHFYVIDGQGWDVTVDPETLALDPATSATVNFSVGVPLDTMALTTDVVNITVTSDHNGSRFDYIDLTVSVVAQTFGLDVGVVLDTQAGLVNTDLTYQVHAKNLGNNRDSITVSWPTAPSGWQITGPYPTLTLYPNESVDVDFVVRLRSSYSWEPWWNFTVNFVAGDDVTNRSIDIHARFLLPDFVVGLAGIVVNTTTPNEGSLVSVQVNVVNVGAPIDVAFAVSLRGGFGNMTAIIDMTSAGTTTASFDVTATAGSMGLEAIVDSTNAVPEENKDNNRATLLLQGNFRPTAAASANASAKVGEVVSVSAAGSVDDDGSIATYYFDFGDSNNSGWTPGASASHVYAAEGNFTITVRVRDDRGSESAAATDTISIAPAGSNSGGNNGGNNGEDNNGTGSGGGSGATGADMTLYLFVALLAVAAGVAMLFMRRRAPRAPSGTPPAQAPPEPPAQK